MPLTFKKDKLTVSVFSNRQSMGEAAALMVSNKIKALLRQKEYINIIFAAAPSQNEFLAALLNYTSIPWNKIKAFHMDEYLGLPQQSPQLFGNCLKSKLFGHAPLHTVNYINGTTLNIELECDRYTTLLYENPPDIVCMGIGENSHIAFNEPHKADFTDPKSIKIVTLDQASRQQQLNDGCFNAIAEVPAYALTLTIPALMKAPFIYCMVPGKTKASAIWHTLNEPITAAYPSTILRNYKNAFLFLDEDSYSKIKPIKI